MNNSIYINIFIFFIGKRRYNIKLWKIFIDCFNCLFIVVIIDEKIFCCYGGKNLFYWGRDLYIFMCL